MSREISQALTAWRRLYDGELETYSAPETRACGSPEITAAAVRRPDFRAARGNWPKIFHHPAPVAKALVLIHGLKDSPGYLEDVALRFAAHGANVVLPLLAGHGRRDPLRAMKSADREAWRSTVDRAVEIAAMLGDEVSIGGLSTGGALAVDKCLRDGAAIGGKLFLFSAALGLGTKARLALSGRILPAALDVLAARQANTGIGGDPHKYSRDFFVASRQVHLLTEDIRRHGDRLALRDRSFVAHSEADRTIPIAAVMPFVRQDDPGQHHIIHGELDVAHGDLVLASAMTHGKRWPDEPPAPRANPEFEAMMEKALAFLERSQRSPRPQAADDLS